MGRLWKRYGLSSITLDISPLPVHDNGNGDWYINVNFSITFINSVFIFTLYFIPFLGLAFFAHEEPSSSAVGGLCKFSV